MPSWTELMSMDAEYAVAVLQQMRKPLDFEQMSYAVARGISKAFRG